MSITGEDFYTPDEIDFTQLLERVARRWYVIIICVVFALLLAIVYLNTVSYRYTATMKVAPIQSSQQNGLGSKLGRLSSLASVAGVSLPGGSGALDFDLYVEGLQSRDVADLLAQDHELMHGLYYREWDDGAHRWSAPSGSIVGAVNGLKGLLGIPGYPYRAPDGARVLVLLQRNVIVDRSLRTPIVTVTFDDEHPQLAVKMLERINAAIDGLLRQRALGRSNEAIRFLQENLRTVQLVEQRTAIADLLGNQMQIRMSATSSQPFAAEVFEHPAASFRPTSPLPPRTLVIAALFGLIVGLALALAWGPVGRSANVSEILRP